MTAGGWLHLSPSEAQALMHEAVPLSPRHVRPKVLDLSASLLEAVNKHWPLTEWTEMAAAMHERFEDRVLEPLVGLAVPAWQSWERVYYRRPPLEAVCESYVAALADVTLPEVEADRTVLAQTAMARRAVGLLWLVERLVFADPSVCLADRSEEDKGGGLLTYRAPVPLWLQAPVQYERLFEQATGPWLVQLGQAAVEARVAHELGTADWVLRGFFSDELAEPPADALAHVQWLKRMKLRLPGISGVRFTPPLLALLDEKLQGSREARVDAAHVLLIALRGGQPVPERHYDTLAALHRDASALQRELVTRPLLAALRPGIEGSLTAAFIAAKPAVLLAAAQDIDGWHLAGLAEAVAHAADGLRKPQEAERLLQLAARLAGDARPGAAIASEVPDPPPAASEAAARAQLRQVLLEAFLAVELPFDENRLTLPPDALADTFTKRAPLAFAVAAGLPTDRLLPYPPDSRALAAMACDWLPGSWLDPVADDILAGRIDTEYLRPAVDHWFARQPYRMELLVHRLRYGAAPIRVLAARALLATGDSRAPEVVRAQAVAETDEKASATLLDMLLRTGHRHLLPPQPGLRATAPAKTKSVDCPWLPTAELPALAWRDGSEMDTARRNWLMTSAVRVGEPAALYPLTLWLDEIDPDTAAAFARALLQAFVAEETRRRSPADLAAAIAGELDAATVASLAPNVLRKRQKQLKARFGGVIGNATKHAGLLALADGWAREADLLAAVDTLTLHGDPKRSKPVTALATLLVRRGTLPAACALLRLRDFAAGTALEPELQRSLAQMSEDSGISSDLLADFAVPSLGLDSIGRRSFGLSGGDVHVQVLADGKLTLCDDGGQALRTLPKAQTEDAEAHAIAKTAVAQLRTHVPALLQREATRLQQGWAVGRSWSMADWTAVFVRHPLMRLLATRCVWQCQDDNGAYGFRPELDGTALDAAGDTVALPLGATVQLASRFSGVEPAAWQQHMADFSIEALFDQWLDLPEAIAEQVRASGGIRFARPHATASYPLLNAMAAMGWRRGQGNIYYRAFPSAGYRAVLSYSGPYLVDANHPLELQSLHFQRLTRSADIVFGHLGDGAERGVPPLTVAIGWADMLKLGVGAPIPQEA